MNSLCFLGTLLWINNIDLLYWWIGYRYWCVPTFWPRLPLRPSKDTLRQSVFLVGASLRILHSLMYSSLSLSAGQWVRGQQDMLGYGNSEEPTQSHTSERIQSCSDASGWSCERKLQCQNQLWKRTRETKRWVHWVMLSLALRLESVCLCMQVCVSVFKTDRLTDCQSPCCMHDLSHSSPGNTM